MMERRQRAAKVIRYATNHLYVKGNCGPSGKRLSSSEPISRSGTRPLVIAR